MVADPDTAEGKNDPQRRNTQTFVDKKELEKGGLEVFPGAQKTFLVI